MQPGVRWFKGPSGEAFKFQCTQGIHVPSLAAEVQLKDRPLKVNGVVVDYNDRGYISLEEAALFIEELGRSEANAIPVDGQPVAVAASTLAAATPIPPRPSWAPAVRPAAAGTSAGGVPGSVAQPVSILVPKYMGLKRKRDDALEEIGASARKSKVQSQEVDLLKFYYLELKQQVERMEELCPGIAAVEEAAETLTRFVSEDAVEQLREAVFLINTVTPLHAHHRNSKDAAAEVTPQLHHDQAFAPAPQQSTDHGMAQQLGVKASSSADGSGSSSHVASRASDSHGQTGKDAECVGFFYSSRHALTTEHGVSNVELGSLVVGTLPKSASSRGKQQLSLKVVYKDAAADIAVLELSDGVHPKWLKLSKVAAPKLPGAVLALGTYNIALLQDLPKFNTALSVWPAGGVCLGRQQQHLLYSGFSWKGDSGSPLVTLGGAVVGIHIDGVNQLVDQFAHLPVAAGPRALNNKGLNESLLAAHNSIEELQAAVQRIAASPASGSVAVLLTALPQQWLDCAE